MHSSKAVFELWLTIPVMQDLGCSTLLCKPQRDGRKQKVDYRSCSTWAVPRQCSAYLDTTIDIFEHFNLLVPD